MTKRTKTILTFAILAAFGGHLFLASDASASVPVAPQGQTFTVVLAQARVPATALAAITAAGGTVVGRMDALGVLQVEAAQPAAFLRALHDSSEVASVGPAIRVKPHLWGLAAASSTGGTTPTPANDPNGPAAYQWNIAQVTQNGAAWSVHRGSHDVVVAVIDSGMDLGHPDLIGNIVPGSRSFVPGSDVWDEAGHGTHVAGIIAANGRLQGVAPGVGVRAYRVFGADGGGLLLWLTNAIQAAADDGADVINMSLGFPLIRGQITYVDPVTGERISLGNEVADIVALERAIRYAVSRNVVLVGGAGNDGIDLTNPNAVTDWLNGVLQEAGIPLEVHGATIHAPGSLPGVLTVSAAGGGWGTSTRLASYASYGNGVVDLTAPGGDLGPEFPPILVPDAYKYLVLSTVPTYLPCHPLSSQLGLCDYGFAAGTSMAIPHVSGAAALVISQEYARTGKKPSPSQVVSRLQQSADDVGKIGYDEVFGHGMLNVLRALTL
jgi:subtilisin family serine protease